MNLKDQAEYLAERARRRGIETTTEEAMEVVVSNFRPVNLYIDPEPEPEPDLAHQRRQYILALQRKELEEEKADKALFWTLKQNQEVVQTQKQNQVVQTQKQSKVVQMSSIRSRSRDEEVFEHGVKIQPFHSSYGDVKLLITPKLTFDIDGFLGVFGLLISKLSDEDQKSLLLSVRKYFRPDFDYVKNLNLVSKDFVGVLWFVKFKAEALKLVKGWREVVKVYELGFNEFPNPSEPLNVLREEYCEYLKSVAKETEERIFEHNKEVLRLQMLFEQHPSYNLKQVLPHIEVEEDKADLGRLSYKLKPILKTLPVDFVRKLVEVAEEKSTPNNVLDNFECFTRSIVVEDINFVDFKAKSIGLMRGWKEGVGVYEDEMKNYIGHEKAIYEMSILYMKNAISDMEFQETDAVKKQFQYFKEIKPSGLGALASLAGYDEEEEDEVEVEGKALEEEGKAHEEVN